MQILLTVAVSAQTPTPASRTGTPLSNAGTAYPAPLSSTWLVRNSSLPVTSPEQVMLLLSITGTLCEVRLWITLLCCWHIVHRPCIGCPGRSARAMVQTCHFQPYLLPALYAAPRPLLPRLRCGGVREIHTCVCGTGGSVRTPLFACGVRATTRTTADPPRGRFADGDVGAVGHRAALHRPI